MVPKCFGYFPEYREVTGTPRGVNGPSWALVEEVRRRTGGGARTPKPNPNWVRVWGWPPFPSLPLPLPYSPTWTRKEGNLLLLGVGIPLRARPLRPALLLLPSFI